MPLLILPLLALAILVTVFLFYFYNLDVTQIQEWILNLPLREQVTLGGIVLFAFWLVVGIARRGQRISELSNRSRETQRALDEFRTEIVPVVEMQRGVEGAISHLATNDPGASVGSLQQRLAQAEISAAEHQGKNAAADLRERLQRVRQGQQALKDRLADIVRERREIEPVLSELRDRQRQIDNALSDLEMDKDRNSLFAQLETVERDALKSQRKFEALLKAFETFKRLDTELRQLQAQLDPLQSAATGIIALSNEAHALRTTLVRALENFELDKLSARVDELTRGKKDIEHKVQALTDGQETLESLRREMTIFEERCGHINQSLGELEVTSSGDRLSDNIRKLDELTKQTRARLWGLQESLGGLGSLKADLENLHAALAPLKEPANGVQGMNALVNGLVEQLLNTIGELERSGEGSIISSLESYSNRKTEAKRRIADLQRCFGELSTMREDIKTLFETLDSSLKRSAMT